MLNFQRSKKKSLSAVVKPTTALTPIHDSPNNLLSVFTPKPATITTLKRKAASPPPPRNARTQQPRKKSIATPVSIKPVVEEETPRLIHDPKELVKTTPLISGSAIVCDTPQAPKIQRFAKHAHLLPSNLDALPKSMELLEKMFGSLETCVNFLLGRKDPVIFHKVKKSVETLCNRSFDLPQLAKIMAIFPNAYEITPIRTRINGARVDSLILTPTGLNLSSGLHEEAAASAENTVERRGRFRDGLLDAVFGAHQAFIGDGGVGKKRGDLQGYHFEFDMERDVPEVVGALLPRYGKTLGEEDAVKTVEKDEGVKPVAIVETKQQETPVVETVEGPPLSRYEALKKREKKSQAEQIFKPTKTASQLQLCALASRFPDMVRCVSLLFTGEGQKGIVIGSVVETVVNSSKVGISKEDAFRCVRMLAEISPQWLKIIRLSDGRDICKMERGCDMARVLREMAGYAE